MHSLISCPYTSSLALKIRIAGFLYTEAEKTCSVDYTSQSMKTLLKLIIETNKLKKNVTNSQIF